jgi:hydrogenase maturation protease
MALHAACEILVIGYGNELRSDDGAGPAVARAIEGLRLPGVHTLVLHQLTPELAENISTALAVIFVDARPASEAGSVEVFPLEAATQPEIRAHHSDPAAVLALAKTLCGRCPPAWLIAIPAADFALGESLSDVTKRGVAEAIQEVRKLCAAVAIHVCC